MGSLVLQLALIAVSVSGIFMVIMPMYEEIGHVQAETDEYQRALDSAVETNKKIASLKSDINQYSQQDKYRIELLVPEDLAPVRAAYDIEELVSDTDMFLTSISVGTIGKAESPVAAPNSVPADTEAADAFAVQETESVDLVSQQLELGVSGTYAQFKELLSKLESSARLIDIVNVSFTGGDSDLNTYSLSLVVYGLSTDVMIKN